jgi:riboflavin biosynthesis pyrimidine reductase
MILGGTPGTLTEDEVVAAYPWPEGRRWVRAMMVTTLDGAAVGPDGLSGSISGEADKAVFNAVRREADVVLIGAGTMRAERYGPFRNRARIAIASQSLDLPWDERLFTESAERPIILTAPDADPDRVAEAEETCQVVVVEGDTPASYVVALEQLGLPRIVCEGGPNLLGQLVEAGLVDEADITVSPTMAGNAQTPEVATFRDVAGFDLAHVLTEDGFLMCRYLRRRGAPASDGDGA